jgi:hypothetical protein
MDKNLLRNKLIIESYFNITLSDDYNYSNILELVNTLFDNEVNNQRIEEIYGYNHKEFIINNANNNKKILTMYLAELIITVFGGVIPELTLKVLFDNGLETLESIKNKSCELIDSKTACQITDLYPLEMQINILRKGLRTGGESNYNDSDIATMNTAIDTIRQLGNTEKNTVNNTNNFTDLEVLFNNYNQGL